MTDVLHALAADLKVALRQLRRQRTLTAAAVACLALGIGANAAIFSVVDGVLFRPLPYLEPNRLVMVGEWLPVISNNNFGTISTGDFLDYQQLTGGVFESMAAFEGTSVTLEGAAVSGRAREQTGPAGGAERVPGLVTTATLFHVLGARPALGRPFAAGDDALGSPETTIISNALWRHHFGADPRIIGRTIVVEGRPTTVIGVMPPDFAFPPHGLGLEAAELYTPLRIGPEVLAQRANSYDGFAIARLATGVPVERANAAVEAIAARLPELYPGVYHRLTIRAGALPLHAHLVTDLRRSLLLLLGAVVFVLLIACFNVSGLLLARTAARSREIAMRIAVGASRGRLVRQFLVESAVLTVSGAAAALVVSRWTVGALAARAPADLLGRFPAGLDGRVILFTIAVTLAASVTFSLVPALSGFGGPIASRLREEGRGTGSSGASPVRQRGRRALVVAELALALVLATGAGLLVRSFSNAERVDPGFDPDRLLSLQVVLPAYRYPGARALVQGEERLIAGLRRIPGVTSASAAVNLPMAGQWRVAVSPEGPPLPKVPLAVANAVLPGYFETLGIHVLQGRSFDAHDDAAAPPAVIVDESFAKRYFPGASAVGRRLKWGSPQSTDPWKIVVGVAATVKAHALDEDPELEVYFPVRQISTDSAPAEVLNMFRGLRYVIRTAGDPLALANQARAAVRQVDADLPVAHLEDGGELVAASVASRRFETLLVGAFAALALVLAAAGLYGVVAYSVVQRVREIGVRMALGATPSRVTLLVLGEGIWTAGVGALVGLAGAIALTRLMRSLLFGVGALDLATFAAATTLLVGTALLASWLPARRAARVDPVSAMRGD